MEPPVSGEHGGFEVVQRTSKKVTAQNRGAALENAELQCPALFYILLLYAPRMLPEHPPGEVAHQENGSQRQRFMRSAAAPGTDRDPRSTETHSSALDSLSLVTRSLVTYILRVRRALRAASPGLTSSGAAPGSAAAATAAAAAES